MGEKTDNALSTEKGDEHGFAPRKTRYVQVTILHKSANNLTGWGRLPSPALQQRDGIFGKDTVP